MAGALASPAAQTEDVASRSKQNVMASAHICVWVQSSRQNADPAAPKQASSSVGQFIWRHVPSPLHMFVLLQVTMSLYCCCAAEEHDGDPLELRIQREVHIDLGADGHRL